MNIYMSEERIISEEMDLLDIENIKPGSKSICHASVKVLLRNRNQMAKAKLDSCGSVSIAHNSNLLNSIKPAQSYELLNIRLRGTGGKTNMLKEIGILQIKRPDNENCEMMSRIQ
jgi:hypothetical protein